VILSFGYTTDALLAGVKTVTRRDWHDKYAQQWMNRVGELADAWNTSPRVISKNPHRIATIRLLGVQLTQSYPDEDYELEGLRWMEDNGLAMPVGYHRDPVKPSVYWRAWQQYRPLLYRVEFEVVEYLEGPLALPGVPEVEP